MEAAIAGAIVAVLMSGLFALQSDHDAAAYPPRRRRRTPARTCKPASSRCGWATGAQLTDPNWVQSGTLLKSATEADVNLPGLSETYTVTVVPIAVLGRARRHATPAVHRDAAGERHAHGFSGRLQRLPRCSPNQEMLQVDLSVTWPGLGRTRTRAQMSRSISPWGISK